MPPDLLTPVTLSSPHVTLIPLAPDHLQPLIAAATDGELWNLWYTFVPTPANMAAEIARRLALQHSRFMLPFTVLDAAGTIAGMTTFMRIDDANRRVEIGSTWYARRVQRTALNTAAKLLLLTHAFEHLQVIAVEFRTHGLNQQSRRAIERLGAKLDGLLRNASITPTGTLRDDAVYSILPHEWPAIKAHLQWQLQKPR